MPGEKTCPISCRCRLSCRGIVIQYRPRRPSWRVARPCEADGRGGSAWNAVSEGQRPAGACAAEQGGAALHVDAVNVK